MVREIKNNSAIQGPVPPGCAQGDAVWDAGPFGDSQVCGGREGLHRGCRWASECHGAVNTHWRGWEDLPCTCGSPLSHAARPAWKSGEAWRTQLVSLRDVAFSTWSFQLTLLQGSEIPLGSTGLTVARYSLTSSPRWCPDGKGHLQGLWSTTGGPKDVPLLLPRTCEHGN